MRLIDTRTLTLRDFPFGTVPRYAILSHTWGAEEVTFEDFKTGGYEKSLGWAKIQRFCATSRELGFEFGWVDTCCIDKSSSAELSEAINSMFQWYKVQQYALPISMMLDPNVQ
ncbi:vegetative incompatibility protein HET-E-1 [Rhypophila decipiens]|uniref:Vegetative incompatibility protein HET-E-1 n=1 Tax=Rhypophila decipiens TaxID=261697 RepID=A0AAN6YAE1_9PEZI|nr:vegetative incompatibility protein HET-E-1 [Rhypophila decipiens]